MLMQKWIWKQFVGKSCP